MKEGMSKSENHPMRKADLRTRQKKQTTGHHASWWTPPSEALAPTPPEPEPDQLNGTEETESPVRHRKDGISKTQIVGNSKRPRFFSKKFLRKNKKGIQKTLNISTKSNT